MKIGVDMNSNKMANGYQKWNNFYFRKDCASLRVEREKEREEKKSKI